MTALKISLCMIVKNESRFLGKCLESAKNICTQMIVVDTGSTDNTIEIAKAHGADVYEHEWPGHFSDARNLSLQYATEDWILILDGDEVLDTESLHHLTQLSEMDSEHMAYEFEIVNYSTDDATEDSAHFQKQVRLFRNQKEHRYAGIIHNQLVNTNSGIGLEGPFLPVRVFHFGYIPSVWSAQNKAARLSMLEQALADNPESLFCHYNLANHLKILGNHARALAHYVACFEGDIERPWVKMSFFSAAFCANKLGQHQLAIECTEKLLDTHPNIADAHLRRAEALLAMNRADLVIQVLEPIVGHPDLYAFKTVTTNFALPYRLGRAYFLEGQHENALSCFIPLADDTTDVTVFTHICVCALSLQEYDLAVEAFKAGIELDANEPDWIQLGRSLSEKGFDVPSPGTTTNP